MLYGLVDWRTIKPHRPICYYVTNPMVCNLSRDLYASNLVVPSDFAISLAFRLGFWIVLLLHQLSLNLRRLIFDPSPFHSSHFLQGLTVSPLYVYAA